MFQWHYFFIFVFLGFCCGYTNPDVPPHRIKPVSNFFAIVVLVTFISTLVNLFTFGFFWVILTIIEIGIGYLIGRKISLGN